MIPTSTPTSPIVKTCPTSAGERLTEASRNQTRDLTSGPHGREALEVRRSSWGRCRTRRHEDFMANFDYDVVIVGSGFEESVAAHLYADIQVRA